MNKKVFLKKLRENLSILEENEINDIINEYGDIIDEKVKNGEDEKKAISDFGEMDELVSEILKAYKINPKFSNNNESFEDYVKKGASKLADYSKQVVDNVNKENISVEFIFEILIKTLILLVLLAILRLPFKGISFLGEAIFDFGLFPLNKILVVIWNIVIWLLYIASCVLIGFAIFKNNLNIKKNKEDIKETQSEIKKNENSIKKEEVKSKKKNQGINVSDIILLLVKIFVSIFILVPFIFCVIGLLFALVCSIYYLIIGIDCLGIVLFLLGLVIINILICNGISSIFSSRKHYYLIPFIISVVCIASGIILSFDWCSKLNISNDYVSSNFNYITSEFKYSVDSPTKFILDGDYNIYIVEDEDNLVTIKANYYDGIINVKEFKEKDTISIDRIYNNGFKVYHEIIDNLKDNKIYNYEKMNEVTYDVYVSSNVEDIIKIK